MSIVSVIVDIPTRALAEPFDYEVPAHLEGLVSIGSGVLVDFAGRPAVGWVVDRPADSRFDKLKPIRESLSSPQFDEVAARTALWIARTYCSTPADAIRLFLPPGSSPTAVRLFRAAGPEPDDRYQAAVWQAAAEPVSANRLLRDVPAATSELLERMNRAGSLEVSWELKRPTTSAVDERWVEIVRDAEYIPPANATLQRAVLDMLTEGPVALRELSLELGAVSSAVNRLSELGVVRVEDRRRFRGPVGGTRRGHRPDSLSAGQTAALAAVNKAIGHGGVVVLDGVTGSGKTEVYLRSIERVLSDGGSAVVLVPEISLTPQTVGRFRARFGDLVAVLHSRLSAGERLDEWDRLRSGEARVAVGARSALFAPVSKIQLVVIDEEHEGSYKQGSAPRYHAVRVAERLCAERGAALVLGSATPRIETLERVRSGEWSAVRMSERVAGGSVPPVTVVDMAAEFAEGHRSMFSRPLLERLEEVAKRRQKAVLLLNRRGFASFLLCRECGFVPECDSCSTSMTYHERGPVLVCHHCAARRPVPPRCPSCGSPYLRLFGAGTQRVESELAELFPSLPVVRMDADTTTGKGGHEGRLAEFEALGSGILLGTQMVAKGLDYPEVTLVGVLNADTTLHLPDFRSAERTYQLLAQVAGRAGRGPAGGSVVIQTYWPDHPAIVAVATGDREPFFEAERESRRELGYPPYGSLANVVVSSGDSTAARTTSERLAAEIAAVDSGVDVLGPSPAPLARLKRAYRWHIVLKAQVESQLDDVLAAALRDTPATPGVSVAPDIDPYDML